MCRVEEVDPPAGSGALCPPAGRRAAALHLGAAEGQSTDTSTCAHLWTKHSRMIL